MYGTYSEYAIYGIYDEEELAKKYIDKFNVVDKDKRFWIEEHIVNNYKDEINNGYNPYCVRITKNGTCLAINKESRVIKFCDKESRIFHNDDILECNMFAKDEKHAVKIANELRTELIVNNKWGEK